MTSVTITFMAAGQLPYEPASPEDFMSSLAKSPNNPPVVVSARLKRLILQICQVNTAGNIGPAPGCLLNMTAGWPLVWRGALHGVMEGPGKPSWCLMLYLVWPEIFCAMVVMSWILGYGSNLRRGADSNRLSSSKAAYSAPQRLC